MKKYAILTSVLALTACGGGSGGGNPGEIVTPSNYVDRVAQSNANITGMISNSEYQVVKYVANKLGDDAKSVNLSRTATIRSAFQPSNPNSGNIDYDTARELVDLAGWLVDETTSETDIVEMFNKSTLDKNKIKAALKLMDDMYCFVGGDAEETAHRIKGNDFAKQLVDLQQKTTVFNLKDVSFKTIPTSGVISELKFHTKSNGEIEAIEFVDAEKIMKEHEGSDVPVGLIKRDRDTNKFVEHQEYEGQVVDIPIEYVSYAQQLGLKYSDFGVLRTDIASTGVPEAQGWGVMETPFAGGYDVKNVDNTHMTDLAKDGDMVFAGFAKGRVSYHDWDEGIDGVDVALEGGLSDEHATLTFKQDGTQTLAADFKNWAKIEAVKSPNGTNQFKVMENYTESDSPYYIETSSAGLVDGDMGGEHNMAMQTGYYGDNNQPNEAVGLVQYQHSWGDKYWVESQNRWDVENHVNVDLGFGGKIEK